MVQHYLDYIKVVLGSAFKFIIGPVYGVLDHHLSLFETIVFTSFGMMLAVVVVSYFGGFLKERIFGKFGSDKVKVNKKRKKIVKVWNKHGLKGVAFLTPLIFTPIGGALIAVSFGAKRKELFTYMFISAVFWSTIISSFLFFFEGLLRRSGLI